MSSAMTAQLLVKKSCVNLCSLCCSCCSIANYSVIKPKDHWVFFQLLCFNIFLPFYYKEYLLKKSGEVCKSTKDFNPILSSHKRKPQQLKTPKYFWPHRRGAGEEGEHGVWGVPLMGQGRASRRMHEGPAHTNTHCSSSSSCWCAAAIHRHSPAGAAMGSPVSGGADGRERVV